MSQAQASITVKFNKRTGTISSYIASPAGDLFQQYEGAAAAPSKVSPDFELSSTTNPFYRPELLMVCGSSIVGQSLTLGRLDVYVNGLQAAFGADNVSTGVGSTTAYAGCFEKTASGIKILKNLVKDTAGSSVVIRMVRTVGIGANSTDIEASYTIPITKGVGTGKRVTIAAGDAQNFTITARSGSGSSCTLKALVLVGGAIDPGAYAYQWQRFNPAAASAAGAWTDIAGANSQAFVVTEAMVSAHANFRVAVTEASGAEVGSDVQEVVDLSDPLEVRIAADPADATIIDGDAARSEVKLTASVWDRESNTRLTAFSQFYWLVADAAGNILNPYNDRTPAEEAAGALGNDTYYVTLAQAQQADGDVSVTVTSENK